MANIEKSPDTLAASKVVVTEGTMPSRIVLRDLGREYVTHIEVLRIIMRDGEPVFVHHSYGNGHYFTFPPGADDLTKARYKRDAETDFKERAAKL